MEQPPSQPSQPRGGAPDAVAALLAELRAVASAVPPPPSERSLAAVEAYLGDVVAIVYHGAPRRERLALLARLTALADAAARPPGERAAPPAAGMPGRLERTLRRWERLRRTGAGGPRPTEQQLRERLDLLADATDPGAPLGVDVVAIAVAELVAQELLAGPVSVESGMRAVRELEPVAEDGKARLRGTGFDAPAHVFSRPGATLAHIDQAVWQLESMTAAGVDPDDLPAAQELWTEVAAGLVFVHDVSIGRVGRDDTWNRVLAVAVDLLTLGELGDAPEAYDWQGACEQARSAALRFAGAWLDAVHEGRGSETRRDERERLQEAAARAVLGAWAAARLAAQRSS